MSTSQKFVVWIKETRESRWEEQGDGALPPATATRIAREIAHLVWAVRVKPEGITPED